MFEENKNLKDSSGGTTVSITDIQFPISYNKTKKLITALYMVTDIIDELEPLRTKLRTLGVGILSDVSSIERDNTGRLTSVIVGKINDVMSFLDIASALNIISEMNFNILKKEFYKLNQSVLGSVNRIQNINSQINLAEFFRSGDKELESRSPAYLTKGRGSMISNNGLRENYKGHTRIGVQRGSTLMQALSDKTIGMSNINFSNETHENFDILKKQRRNEIVSVLNSIGHPSTIKDIKDKVQSLSSQYVYLSSCSEKTLQRELISMVIDKALNKNGEKRWSRYFLN